MRRLTLSTLLTVTLVIPSLSLAQNAAANKSEVDRLILELSGAKVPEKNNKNPSESAEQQLSSNTDKTSTPDTSGEPQTEMFTLPEAAPEIEGNAEHVDSPQSEDFGLFIIEE